MTSIILYFVSSELYSMQLTLNEREREDDALRWPQNTRITYGCNYTGMGIEPHGVLNIRIGLVTGLG